MKTHTFFVENIKCNGCAETIRKSALKFSGVQKVVVLPDESKITLELTDDFAELESLKNRIAKLGYPEMGQNNLAFTARSYLSCAVGKMSPKS